jgi:putative ABC transport system substrate-binding protein
VLLLLSPVAGDAQQSERIYKLAYVSPTTSPSAQMNEAVTIAFVQQLRSLGWVEGRNLAIEFRTLEGKFDRAAEVFTELVRQNVDVIVTPTNELGQVAMKVTLLTPIVVTDGIEMVQNGLVASLAKPGGNVTGLEISAGGMTDKRMQLLKEAVPSISRLAFLFVRRDPTRRPTVQPELMESARTLGVTPVFMPTEPLPERFEEAFASIRPKPDAVLISANIASYVTRRFVADLLIQHRLPAVAWDRGFAEAGVLMSYGYDNLHNSHRAAVIVDKILRGTKPGNLPVERPTKFELFINLKTAKALELTIPGAVLQRADHIIE